MLLFGDAKIINKIQFTKGNNFNYFDCGYSLVLLVIGDW